jgi:biopolymer transport protein ExbB/TolQ
MNKLLDVFVATAVGLALAVLALAYFDVLFY